MVQLRRELIQVKRAATVDALTSLLNRGGFDQALEDDRTIAARRGLSKFAGSGSIQTAQ